MYYYNNELPPQQGWVCPKCGRVNAPWMPTCGCVSSQTSGTPYLVKTSSISRDSHEIAKDEPQNGYQTFNGTSVYVSRLEDDGQTEKGGCTNCDGKDLCNNAFAEISQYCGAYEPQTEEPSFTATDFGKGTITRYMDEPQIIKVGMATDSVTGKVLGITADTDCAWK